MSSTAALGASVAYSQAAQGQIELGARLTKMAHEADNAMVNMLDQLVQQNIEKTSAKPEGMGQAIDVKA